MRSGVWLMIPRLPTLAGTARCSRSESSGEALPDKTGLKFGRMVSASCKIWGCPTEEGEHVHVAWTKAGRVVHHAVILRSRDLACSSNTRAMLVGIQSQVGLYSYLRHVLSSAVAMRTMLLVFRMNGLARIYNFTQVMERSLPNVHHGVISLLTSRCQAYVSMLRLKAETGTLKPQR